jgi:hypothetical protein
VAIDGGRHKAPSPIDLLPGYITMAITGEELGEDVMWHSATSVLALYVGFDAPLSSDADATTLAANVVATPLPSAWIMMVGAFVLAFLAYRLFSA